MKTLTFSLWALLITILLSCESESINDHLDNDKLDELQTDTIHIKKDQTTPSIDLGFYGFIIELKGDFMPGIEPGSGTTEPVQMDLYVYEKLTYDSIQNARTEKYSLFWYVDKIKQTPLAIIKTNNKGFYEIELPIGDYSGFVKIDEQRLYNNGGRDDGYIGAMILNDNDIIKRYFKIDCEASY